LNNQPQPDTTIQTEEIVLREWTVHLLRQDPARARVVFAAMLLSSVLGLVTFRSAVFALLGPLLLLSAASEYLLPIRYRLTTLRACASYGAARLEIEWSKVKRVDKYTESAKLSPFAFPNRLDNFRGVILRFAPAGETGDRIDVLELISELVTTQNPQSTQSTGNVSEAVS
jgi:hypothetical protein